MERPVFKFPQKPMSQVITNANGNPIQERLNKMEMYIWKKDYKFVHKQMAEFKEKEERVFPIIPGHCSPSLRSQLEGTKSFKDTCEKNDIIEFLKIICSICCKHDMNSNIMLSSTASAYYLSIFRKLR